ncbi:MAG: 4Fe-4S ferredoxin, partial [Geobacter sp.]
MTSMVYFADMRTGNNQSLFDKLGSLLQSCGIARAISTNDLVAVKVHFGERG